MTYYRLVPPAPLTRCPARRCPCFPMLVAIPALTFTGQFLLKSSLRVSGSTDHKLLHLQTRAIAAGERRGGSAGSTIDDAMNALGDGPQRGRGGRAAEVLLVLGAPVPNAPQPSPPDLPPWRSLTK